MLKAADALHEAGYDVRVICTRHTAWAGAADDRLRGCRPWRCDVIDYDSRAAPGTYVRTGIRFRTAQAVAQLIGRRHCPLSVAARGYSRVHTELVRAALAEPADLYYGGTTGALAATAEAGRRAQVPYALDLEDFHGAEREESADGQLAHGLAERIQQRVLRGATFLTAGSDAIAAAYADTYGVHPITLHNTFPLPAITPDFSAGNGHLLRLCWFSQTIGPRRGLDDVVHAMGLVGTAGELHLRGRAMPEYLQSLRALAGRVAPRLAIIHHEPCDPDTLIDACRRHDVGLAVEPGFSLNNRLALSNKAFTYMLAGLAVAFTDTPGQRPLAIDMGAGALLYVPGDVAALATGLRRWADDGEALRQAKRAAWAAAAGRWHWQHPAERGALLNAVAQVFA
jgi:hypothetical protein